MRIKPVLIHLSKINTMSYKFIFNTDVSGLLWGTLQNAIEAATKCGYKFILFNGEVYHHSGERTGITAKDCF